MLQTCQTNFGLASWSNPRNTRWKTHVTITRKSSKQKHRPSAQKQGPPYVDVTNDAWCLWFSSWQTKMLSSLHCCHPTFDVSKRRSVATPGVAKKNCSRPNNKSEGCEENINIYNKAIHPLKGQITFPRFIFPWDCLWGFRCHGWSVLKLTTEMSYLKTLDPQYKIENPASNQSTKTPSNILRMWNLKTNSSKVFPRCSP